MNHLEGMIRNTGYDGWLSEDMWVGQPSDMRPKEEFREGYMVKCPGVPGCLLGQVLTIDPDERLAKVAWMSGKQGWWYLKDLVVVGIPTGMKRKFVDQEVGDCFDHKVHGLAMTGVEEWR